MKKLLSFAMVLLLTAATFAQLKEYGAVVEMPNKVAPLKNST